MKKILCTILSAIMAFSALTFAVPTVASAAESQESVSETYGDFEYIVISSSAYITAYTGNAESVTIPSKIAGYKVTKIHYWAFSNCTKLKSVVIPNGVTSIGANAFNGCTSLSSIVIPNSVTSIGYDAFKSCTSLSNITIPDSVTEVGEDAFTDTKWFDNQPDGVVYVGKAVYDYKGNMPKNTKITIKQGSKSISPYAFSDCTNLTNIVIPNSVMSIGGSAFRDCTSLSSIVIPNNVTSIGAYTFNGCANLSDIVIPDSVTEVGEGAFWTTKWFDNQPDGVVYVGKAAYDYKGNMPKNTKIVLKQGTKSISSYAFIHCTNLTNIVIPNGVIKMGVACFDSCENLQEITIPDSLIYISESSMVIGGLFQSCSSLKRINIGSGLKSFFGPFDLNGCNSIESINISKDNKYFCSVDGVAFDKDKTDILYYPPAKKDESYTIPNTVSGLYMADGFGMNKNLKTVVIPKSVKTIGIYTFGTADRFPITIKGYKGTAAEKYAKDNGFKFVALDKPAATAVKLILAKATLNVGQSVTLKATVLPAKAEQKCTWTTSNAKVATVDKNGKVVAKGAGTATITAKTANGKKATCKVTVNPAPTSVKLNAKTATMGVGQSATLKATVSPSKASQKCTWATSNKKVATVTSGGKVVAKGVGTATITVKTYNGKKATCKITVKKAPKSVKPSKTAITLTKGKTYTLKATLSSGSAGSTAWTTSNKKVATVSTKGVVTAKAKGTAYVTVKTYNGKTAKCKVVVK